MMQPKRKYSSDEIDDYQMEEAFASYRFDDPQFAEEVKRKYAAYIEARKKVNSVRPVVEHELFFPYFVSKLKEGEDLLAEFLGQQSGDVRRNPRQQAEIQRKVEEAKRRHQIRLVEQSYSDPAQKPFDPSQLNTPAPAPKNILWDRLDDVLESIKGKADQIGELLSLGQQVQHLYDIDVEIADLEERADSLSHDLENKKDQLSQALDKHAELVERNAGKQRKSASLKTQRASIKDLELEIDGIERAQNSVANKLEVAHQQKVLFELREDFLQHFQFFDSYRDKVLEAEQAMDMVKKAAVLYDEIMDEANESAHPLDGIVEAQSYSEKFCVRDFLQDGTINVPDSEADAEFFGQIGAQMKELLSILDQQIKFADSLVGVVKYNRQKLVPEEGLVEKLAGAPPSSVGDY